MQQVLIGIILVLSFGGYWLYQENITLKANNKALENAVATQEEAINVLNSFAAFDSAGVRKSLALAFGDAGTFNAVAAAQQNIQDNLAKAECDAYSRAQDRRMQAAQMGLGAQQQGMAYGMQGAEAAQGALGQYPTIMGAPLHAYDKMQAVGAQRRAMDQAGIQQQMQKYQYESQLPQIGLQNYLAGISGEYGGTSTGVGPGGPNPLLSALAGAGSGFIPGGPAGAAAGGLYGLAGSL